MLEISKEMSDVCEKILANGRGILAADESTGTIGKRLASINTESTEENRRAYRELLFTTKHIENGVSGVILYDETLRQSCADGTPFPKLLESLNIVPGIKVDLGLVPQAGNPDEKVTQGLDGLPERLKEYKSLGAKFAKWRAIFEISDKTPTRRAIMFNAENLARYARMCQDAGIVPIVEPEVIMDGDHTVERCQDVTELVLHHVFVALHRNAVVLENMLLKPNMVVSGTKCKTQASVEEVAQRTVASFNRTVPAAVPGIVFLSGGQSDELATAHLDAMNKMGQHAWKLSFSYGRALQAPCLKAWQGKKENVEAAQAALYKRSELNRLACNGEYSPDMEKSFQTETA